MEEKMANAENKVSEKKEKSLIDPIYEKFVKSVIRSIGSTEFYEFFMDSISRAENEFQFSNRKMVKTVDLSWVDAIEETLEALQAIITTPRNVIRDEELNGISLSIPRLLTISTKKRATCARDV